MDDALRRRLLEAADDALAGYWLAAHVIAQDHEGERLANWIHAVAHRLEGDLGNSAYWYARCGRAKSDELSTDAELRLIKDESLRADGHATSEGQPTGSPAPWR